MKVVGINGSVRKGGNTAIIIGKFFDELNKEGIETELIQLADYEIQPWRGCFACKGRGNCVFTKDGFTEIFSRIVEAGGIILGSPVYSADVSYDGRSRRYACPRKVLVAGRLVNNPNHKRPIESRNPAGIYLCEFRDCGGERSIVLTVYS